MTKQKVGICKNLKACCKDFNVTQLKYNRQFTVNLLPRFLPITISATTKEIPIAQKKTRETDSDGPKRSETKEMFAIKVAPLDIMREGRLCLFRVCGF